MLRNRSSRLVFALVVLVFLFVIGRNFLHNYLDHALAVAIQERNVPVVRALLAKGASPNALINLNANNDSKPYFQSALFYAISHRQTDPATPYDPVLQKQEANAAAIACLLIQYGADISPSRATKDYYGYNGNKYSYLRATCEKGNLSVLRCLLDRGAVPNVVDLSAAIQYGRILSDGSGRAVTEGELAENARRFAARRQMVSLLRAHGARPSLSQAIELGDIATLKALLAAGTLPDLPDDNNERPLFTAAQNGNVEAVKLLLAHGANPNVETYDTPLHRAIAYKHVEAARLLLTRGAEPNRDSKHGRYSLLAEAIAFTPSLVSELLKRGADVNAGSGQPLRAALRARRLDLVQELLRRGAQVNPPRPPGTFKREGRGLSSDMQALFSPMAVALFHAPECEEMLRRAGGIMDAQDKQICMMTALKANRPELLPKLLAMGIDVNQLDVDGEIPLTQAILHAPAGVRILLEHGARPNAAARFQHLPLELAALSGQVENVGLLLAHGANPNACAVRGHTALHWARKHRFTNIVVLLQKAGATVNQ